MAEREKGRSVDGVAMGRALGRPRNALCRGASGAVTATGAIRRTQKRLSHRTDRAEGRSARSACISLSAEMSTSCIFGVHVFQTRVCGPSLFPDLQLGSKVSANFRQNWTASWRAKIPRNPPIGGDEQKINNT